MHLPASIFIHSTSSCSPFSCAFSRPLHFLHRRRRMQRWYPLRNAIAVWQLLLSFCFFFLVRQPLDFPRRGPKVYASSIESESRLATAGYKSLTGYQTTRLVQNVAHSPPIKTSQPSSDPSLSIRPASTPMHFSSSPRCKVHHPATGSPHLHCLSHVRPLMARFEMQKTSLRT